MGLHPLRHPESPRLVATRNLPLFLHESLRLQKWMVLGFLVLGVGMVQILRVVHPGSQASTSGWSPRLQGRPLGLERLVFRRFHSFLHCLPSSSPTTETLKDPPET